MKIYKGVKVGSNGSQTVFVWDSESCKDTPLPLEPSLTIYNHSPDGFQWGYTGSGPSQLALALLLDVTGDPELAHKHHQEFKRQFVAGWGDVFAVTGPTILNWLEGLLQSA